MSIMASRPAPINPSGVSRQPSTRPKPRPRPLPRPRPNPRDRWPAWTDSDRWTIADAPASDIDLTDYASRLGSPDLVEPTPASQAWWSAWLLGYDHVKAGPPGERPDSLTLTWWHGYNLAWLRRLADDAEILRMTPGRRQPVNHLTDADVHPGGVC